MKPSQEITPSGVGMTASQVVQWAEAFTRLHARIATRVARPEPRRRALAYLQGIREFHRAQKWLAIGRAGKTSQTVWHATLAVPGGVGRRWGA